MDQESQPECSELREMNSPSSHHSLSHLHCVRTYRFEFTGINSTFVWEPGNTFVQEIPVKSDLLETIDISDLSLVGPPDVVIKKVIKKVSRIKTEEELNSANVEDMGNNLQM